MARRNLVIAIGNEQELISKMKAEEIPFFQMRFPLKRRKSKDQKTSREEEIFAFIDRVNQTMCPQKNKGAEKCYVLLAGIRNHEEFGVVFDNLTERCEYEIFYFETQHVDVREVTALLKDYHQDSGKWYHVPWVNLYSLSTPKSMELSVAS